MWPFALVTKTCSLHQQHKICKAMSLQTIQNPLVITFNRYHSFSNINPTNLLLMCMTGIDFFYFSLGQKLLHRNFTVSSNQWLPPVQNNAISYLLRKREFNNYNLRWWLLRLCTVGRRLLVLFLERSIHSWKCKKKCVKNTCRLRMAKSSRQAWLFRHHWRPDFCTPAFKTRTDAVMK